MHCIYAILRLSALLFDVFVCYHAKDLKLIEEEEHSQNDEEDENEEKEKSEMPTAEHHLVPASPKLDQRKSSKQHKRSASREIRLIFDSDLDKPENESGRKSSGYMVGEISNATSKGII